MAGNTVKGQWTNADGLPVKFPQVYADPGSRTNKGTVAEETLGVVAQLIVPYDLTRLATTTTSFTTDLDNDGVTDSFAYHDAHLPAYATIVSTKVIPTVSAAGGTSLTVGTYKKAGTTISANSLVTATEAVTANLALGNKVIGAGALNTNTGAVAGVGANNAYVGITVTGTFTAGAGFIIIDYIAVVPEAAAND